MNLFINIIVPFLHNIIHSFVQCLVGQHSFDKAVSEKKTRFKIVGIASYIFFGYYLALYKDLSISLTRLSVSAVCVANIVNVTYV